MELGIIFVLSIIALVLALGFHGLALTIRDGLSQIAGELDGIRDAIDNIEVGARKK